MMDIFINVVIIVKFLFLQAATPAAPGTININM